MTEDTRRSTPRAASEPLLPGSAVAFERFAEALNILSLAVPPRVSVRQLLAFAIVANANAMGRSITLSEVREIAGDAIGQSIDRTIQQFFPPTRQDPDGLGWIEQELDLDDRRKKYLKLTAMGRYVVNEMTRALADH